MVTMITKLAAVALAAASVATLAATPSPASSSATTVFRGRFVCGTQPLVGARVELLGEPRAYSSILGIHVADFKVGFTTRGTVYAGSDGEWSFRVPRTKDTNYFVQVALDDGRGTIVADYPSLTASAVVPGLGGTNFNDVPLQDYGTQTYPGDECRLWRALQDVYHGYAKLMGKRPPYGSVVAQYEAPNEGQPYVDYTTIVWPKGFPVTDARVRHEFWHTIRNASLGSQEAFLDEVSTGDVMRRGSPCAHAGAQQAFHEGWAEFWGGDFAPAPTCPGVKDDDTGVEGVVAWTLTRLSRTCAAATPKRMVDVLLAKGQGIHSIVDFRRALGVSSTTCVGTSLDPNDVARTNVQPPAASGVWRRDANAALTSLRTRTSTLSGLLPGADRASTAAACASPPCLKAVGRRLAPDLIRGEIAQARAATAALQNLLSIDASSTRTGPSRRFLASLTRFPTTLATTMSRIGVESIDDALRAARPLAKRDHTARTRTVFEIFRSQRAALVQAQRTAGHYFRATIPLSCVVYWGLWCTGGWSEGYKKTSAAPKVFTHEIAFDFTAAERAAISFGSPTALGFRGVLPKYVCPAAPHQEYAYGRSWGVAPTCDSADPGYTSHYSGLLAKLRFPARSVVADVGANQAIPGGLAAELDAFDANGAPITRTAQLVGSSTNGDTSWSAHRITLVPPLQSKPIVFVALYVNHPLSSVAGVGATQPVSLAVDELVYEERPR